MIKYEQISPVLHEKVKNRFEAYANSFRKKNDDRYNSHIELKQYHTGMVCKEINLLSKSLKMTKEECDFSSVIAWLHDIGRFEQFEKYGTFADAETENHSEIALRVIEKHKILQDFTDGQISIIYSTILNHNKPKVPDGETASVDFYSRLLRDADKLDIWRVAIEINIFHTIKTGPLPEDYEVPEKIVEYFKKECTIPLYEIGSFYDSILFRLSWIFDLNFPYSLQLFYERKLGERFLSKLPTSPKIQEISSIIENYKIPSIPG